MQRVFVLVSNKQPLMPCHPARARKLLKKGKAAVLKRYPFTIIMTHRVGGDLQPIEIKFDPGSRTTGIALVGHFNVANSVISFDCGSEVIWAGHLNHRGSQIKKDLNSRRALRRGRRHRKTRDPSYRRDAARFLNRRRPKGWLPPSLMSRVNNVKNWMIKLSRLAPLSKIAVETVRFDTQKLQKPEISGVEYQQGELAGYELREYLLEKWGRECAYCGAKNVPLQIEHIQARSKGGSDRVSNLTLACTPCNIDKDNKDVKEFLKRKPKRLKKIQAQAKAPLKDAAAVNATCYATGNALKSFGLPIAFSSGGRTKFNRIKQGYKKDHWIDAACVGEGGAKVVIPKAITPLIITANGRGSRQKCSLLSIRVSENGAQKA